MIFNIGSALLDAVVPAVTSKDTEGTYGHKITQGVRQVTDISESALYPALRHPQKESYLEVYDMAIDGRNRRHHRLTEKDRVQLDLCRGEWIAYSQKVSQVFKEAKL